MWYDGRTNPVERFRGAVSFDYITFPGIHSMSDNQTATNLPNDSEGFRTVPNLAEPFGNLPHDAEAFRMTRNISERKENHTLTVRDVARMFEAAGVGRTERSIINWCQPNKSGVARLDCYFDPNDRKYYITPQSVELAISEERAKAAKIMSSHELEEKVPNPAEDQGKPMPGLLGEEAGDIKALKQEIMDLKITNRGKDYFIEQLQKERESFAEERQGYVEKLMNFNRKVGELETRLLQLNAPPGHDQGIGSDRRERQSGTGSE
jgi:hypothetical protein